MYKNGADGLTGNDDCGQMSAWYIWTSLGLYPMNPASGEYVIGFPLLDAATLQLPNGKKLRIQTKGRRTKNAYVKEAYWNGKKVNQYYITHAQLMQGGELLYIL
jgi:putative alpha-1,2-mannosidase